MNAPGDDKSQDAFRLYNEGKFQESLDCCNRLMETAKDPALEVLAATNLFCLHRTEDAEVYFRDLARKMPESSHVHSFLAKILDVKGDDGAVAEYATAVRLDPDNPDALRSYASILVARNDLRGALPVLRRLCAQKKRPDDLDRFADALTRAGFPHDACRLYEEPGAFTVHSPEYANALYAARRFADAAEAARVLYDEQHDPALLRVYLAAQAEADPAGAPAAYAAALHNGFHDEIAGDYILRLLQKGDYFPALAMVKRLVARDKTPQHRLLECRIYAGLGDTANAGAAYGALVRESQEIPCPPETLHEILRSFGEFLFANLPAQEAVDTFLSTVSGEGNVVCLLETARMYSTRGDTAEARAWYYRAYRSDFLNGGLPYALFLYETGDDRESEKVLIHILANIRKYADLARVADAVAHNKDLLFRMKRLDNELVRRLEERRALLGTAERECLALAYLAQATLALEREDFPACISGCLKGIDALPAYAATCQPEAFLDLARRCKEQMPADCPVFSGHAAGPRELPRRTVTRLPDHLALTEQETRILTFLATHHRATEADLRRLTGSRRVAGMVNSLIRKGTSQGIMIVEKKGLSAEGEIYEYCGP